MKSLVKQLDEKDEKIVGALVFLGMNRNVAIAMNIFPAIYTQGHN